MRYLIRFSKADRVSLNLKYWISHFSSLLRRNELIEMCFRRNAHQWVLRLVISPSVWNEQGLKLKHTYLASIEDYLKTEFSLFSILRKTSGTQSSGPPRLTFVRAIVCFCLCRHPSWSWSLSLIRSESRLDRWDAHLTSTQEDLNHPLRNGNGDRNPSFRRG